MSFKRLKDGFINLVKGFGTDLDSREQTKYGINQRISTNYILLEDLYSTNWIARKIADIPVEDAIREGREILNLEGDELIAFNNAYKYLDSQIAKALKLARVYGGAFLVVVIDGEDLSEELDISRIKQGSLLNLSVLTPRHFIVRELDRNPLSKSYLKPEKIQLLNTSIEIHKSRLFYIDGEDTTYYERELMNGLGLSVFEKIYKEIEDASITTTAIRNLVEQSNIDVLKLQDLNDTLATEEGENFIRQKLMATAQMKGILRQLAIDINDDFVNISKNFSTLDKIQMNMFMIVAGASDIPFTRFMGKSPDGMNATGESDLRNYYDMVKSKIQKQRLEPIYNWLDRIVYKSLTGKEKIIDFEFYPLFQLSEKEQTDILTARVNIYNSLLDRGVITEEAVLNELKKDGLFQDFNLEDLGSFEELTQEE